MNFSPVTLSSSSSGGSSVLIMIVYILIFILLIYFMSVRPNRKRQKQLDAMIASIEVGDSVLTTAGFYGVIVDVAEDVVVIEFGNNRQCRIPTQKTAIVSVEKNNENAASSEEDK